MKALKFWGKEATPTPKSDTFDPTLIPRLKQDHRALLDIYTKIKTILESKRSSEAQFRKIEKLLKEFKSRFYYHTILENGPLYGYLRRAYDKDESSIECIHGFKKEMNQIQKGLNQFLLIWNAASISLNPAKFRSEFEAIGEALGGRIESEEERLYRMYAEIPNLGLDSARSTASK